MNVGVVHVADVRVDRYSSVRFGYLHLDATDSECGVWWAHVYTSKIPRRSRYHR
jgi:hypothetical protein